MASKKNKDEYLAVAETAVDNGWKKLPIFEAERSSALLRLVAATDDRIRIAAVGGLPVEAQYSVALRWSIDALTVAVPWIFSAGANRNEPMPSLISEPEYKEGSDLAEYAEAYEAAVIAFTNFHQGRFSAFIPKHEQRITFTHASEEVALAELEKRAYELYESRTEMPQIFFSEKELRPLVQLREVVAEKAQKEEVGDRVKLRFDDELRTALRLVAERELRAHISDIPDGAEFAGVAYGDIRKVRAALAALGTAHEFLHLSPIVKDIEGGAVSSLSFRGEIKEITSVIADIAELNRQNVAQIVPFMTFDGAVPALGSLGQLLICPNGNELIMPRAYSKGGRWERNLLKWMARNPTTKRAYDSFSAQKEGIALPILLGLMRQAEIVARSAVRISKEGKTVTDVDVLAFDPRDGCLLIIQHKWLIEPDSVNESKACDAELERGIDQARVAKTHLGNQVYSQQLMPEIPNQGYSRLEGLVVCKGMEPTGFVQEGDIPVVTERWFKESLTACRALGDLYDLAVKRLDRKKLAEDWKNEFNTWKLEGYELRLPVTVAVIKT